MIETVRRESFGGLRMDEQGIVDAPGGQDLLNVDAPRTGPLRTRGGWAPHSATLMTTNPILRLGYSDAGEGHILALSATQYAAYDSGGTQDYTATVTSGNTPDWANLGTPSANKTYITNGEAAREFSGTAFTTPTITISGGGSGLAFPISKTLAVTPWDNRLIAAGFVGATDGPDGGASDANKLFFSEAGDPLTWDDSNWYEQLTPGDGDAITAAATWGDRVIIFKERKFFTIYGTSQLGAGNPTLDYNPVEQDRGAVGPGAVAPGRDGLYFVDRRGIFVTDGTVVEHISQELDPLFGKGDAPFYSGPTIDTGNLSKATACVVDNDLYVALPTTGNGLVLKSNLDYGGWTVWDIPADAIGKAEFGLQDRVFFGNGTELEEYSTDYTDDDGAAIVAFWTSPWETFGDVEATIRTQRLYGVGTFAVAIGTDYRSPIAVSQISIGTQSDTWGSGAGPDTWGDGSDPTDTWGDPIAYDDGWARGGHRGRLFCTRISNVGGSTFELLWMEHHLTDLRYPVTDTKGQEQ